MLSILHIVSFLIEAEVPFFGAIGGCPLSRGGGRMLTGKPLAFQEVAGPVKLPATSGRTRPLGSKNIDWLLQLEHFFQLASPSACTGFVLWL